MNYVLIGMPGCGKTSLGKAAAKLLSRNFIDIDSIITAEYGDITAIFSNNGESAFRKYETEALKKAVQENDTVISSGGGIIEKTENLEILKNQKIIFIDRNPDSILKTLDSDSRPLLKGDKDALINLYDRRYNKYLEAMDYHVRNDGSFNKCVSEIAKIIRGIS